jgi:hypothetical protein
VAVHGCEEGDSGLLCLVMQAAEVTDLASVGDGGRCGGWKGRHAGGVRQRTEQPADSISTTQVVLPSGVAARFGRGLSNLWAGGLGAPVVCSCSKPLPCAPFSRYGELFWAAGGVLTSVCGRSTVGWSFLVVCGQIG